MTHPSPRPPDDRLRLFGGDDMGRRRGQRKGYLRAEHGSWLLTYYVAKNLGLTRLSWHVFRYSHATFTESIGMSPRDRQSLMGHAALQMTQQYTSDDHDRMRRGLDRIAARLIDDAKGTIQ